MQGGADKSNGDLGSYITGTDIAALLHYFIGDEGDITLDAMIAGDALACWYTTEYDRLFSTKNIASQIHDDSEMVWEWIRRYCRQKGVTFFSKNILRQYITPERFRNKDKLNDLLDILITHGKIAIQQKGKTAYIILNIQYTFWF